MAFRFSLGILGCLVIMALVWLVGPYSAHINFLPDEGPLWYYWKLPEPTFWTRFTAWGLYLAHQLSFWYLIFSAKQLNAQQKLSYSPNTKSGLHRINHYALAVNAFFTFAHIFQTKFFYDGLAQDTSNVAAQLSVIFLLSIVLILENKRRGIVFGKKIKWFDAIADGVKRYHGYYFSWAIIYTFWFHPIEITLGHMLGTLYILFFLLQGSLFFTRFHTNKYWKVFLESFVLIHAAAIAYFSVHNESVSMFVFGFATMFFVTYIYGLNLSNKVIVTLSSIYVLIILVYYSGDYSQLNEIIRIPIILIAFAFILAGIFLLIKRLSKKSNT